MMPTEFMPNAFVPTYVGSFALMIAGGLAATLLLAAVVAQTLYHRYGLRVRHPSHPSRRIRPV